MAGRGSLLRRCVLVVWLMMPGVAWGALPAVGVSVVTTPMANFGAHRGITVTAGCASGTLVGGGGYLRNAASPATPPTNGLVLGGTGPSIGAAPVDSGPADGAVDPGHWFTVANFTGVAEAGDQAATFALCATGGPAHTVVRTASTTGANTTQQVDPPALTTATCAPGTRLIGGGAVTSTPDQVNDGATPGNNGNLKPLASFPSDAAGVAAADGSTSATSWTGYGAAGITSTSDTVTAFALCSTDPSPPTVEVARVDTAGPDAQVGTTITTASPTCPAGTQLLGGGYSVDETVGSTSGLEPQQGYHMRGSYPSTGAGAPPTEVADGAADPATWTALLQAGGQNLSAGSHMNLHGYAMCATAPAAPTTADLGVALSAGPATAVVGQPLTYTLALTNAGPADATGVTASEVLPAGATFVSATSSAGACGQSAGTVTCTVGALASGVSATVTVVVTPTQAMPLTATAAVSGSPGDPNAANDAATLTTTVNLPVRATPTLAGQAAGATLGGSIADQATLAGGSSPTGAITFDLYGPGDTGCTVALATSSVPVTGSGTYASAPFTPTVAGAYRWTAAYGGDGANAPAGPTACTDPGQALVVKAVPALTISAAAAVAEGAATSATATLSGGAVVTGTIVFDLFGPGDPGCTSSIATSSAAVSGNGIYGSAPVTVTAPGSYRWAARYGGDGQNLAAGPTSCSDPAAAFTVPVPAGLIVPPVRGMLPPTQAPSNAFGLTTAKADRHGRITIPVTTPGPGRFVAVASVRIAARGHDGRLTSTKKRYGSQTRTARARGKLTLTIAAGYTGKLLRRSHRSLRVAVAVTFTPTGGKAKSRTIQVKVKGA